MSKCPIPWNQKFDKNKMYIWISEKGENTCETCKKLNGKIFFGGNIPLRPHPNCKCKVVEYDIPNKVNSIIEKKVSSNNIELQKLQQETEDLERKVTLLKGKIIKTDTIDDYENYDAELKKILDKIVIIQQKTEKIHPKYIDEPVITEIKKTIDKIQEQATQTIKNHPKLQSFQIFNKENIVKSEKKMLYKFLKVVAAPPKSIFDKELEFAKSYFKNASALWDISSSKFESKLAQEYIKKNGRIIDKVSDLKDRNLEYFIRTKLSEQIGKSETRGIFFYTDSSLSTDIIKDDNFQNKIREIVKENKNKLIFKRIADDTSFGGFTSPDLRNALGNIDIIDIYIDNQYNLCALIIDTYDFNKKEDNPLVEKGRELQEKGKIENYYSIIPIKIPLEQWKNF